MDSEQPGNSGPLPSGGGKKKQKARQKGQQNAPDIEQQKSGKSAEQNPQQQQKSQEKPGKSAEQNPQQQQKSQAKPGKSAEQNPQQQQKSQAKPGKSAEQKPQQKQKKSKGEQQEQTKSGKNDFPQMSTNIESQKNQSVKQHQPQKQSKDKKPAKNAEGLQKQTKGEKAAQPVPQKSQQVSQQIETIKTNLSIPKRRNPKAGGTAGRKTEVDVNQLPLNLDNLVKKVVYHIDVQFTPDVPKKLLRSALEEFNYRHYRNTHFAFDGRRNMYTTKELKSVTDLVSVLNEENGRTIDFTIVTSVVNVIEMNKIADYLRSGSSNSPPGEAFQALDIILKNRPFSLRFTNVGRSFFPNQRTPIVDLGEGLELWKGFFQSPVMGWKPYLNIDVAHRAFPKCQPLTTYIANELGCNLNSEMDSRSVSMLTAYVTGLKVVFMVPNQPNTKRTYKVVGLLGTAERFNFEMDDPVKGKRTLSVAQYFKLSRNYVVKHPNLPCLHVGNIGKKTAIPIELCTVQKGQERSIKLSESQTAVVVKNAARPPEDRRRTIENCIREIKYRQDPVLKEFGISVGEQFATIPARVLNQPSLAYAAQRETIPKAGVWNPDKFFTAVKVQKWIVLNLDSRTNPESIKNFEKILIASGRTLNVDVSPMYPMHNLPIQRQWRLNDIKREITSFFNAKKSVVEIVVVIMPDYPAGVYATVKQSSELNVGILTQCIKSKTMFRMNDSTAKNILLKINSKLNGVNHILAMRSSPPNMKDAIIFGADVSHPSPDQSSIPSVAAVAASHDLHGSQYNIEWRLQSPKVEIIQDLEDIVHKQLIKFKERAKTIPKKIFYFRDGVSEGQFLQLLEHEFIAIRRACMRLNVNYKPPVTFLVVQKRHNTRMFPKFSADKDGKFNNVCSGTIIDTHITHPTELEFYLCSHSSIQGTSRPTKYHLIWDDNNFTEDDLEQLTFYLCFMFARCTQSVSYPTPTYYAHLAAFRARSYIENKTINLNRLDEEQTNYKLNSDFVANNPMFFT